MKARASTQITIDASPADIYAYLINLKYHYLWNPQIHSISPITALKEGTRYKTTGMILGVQIKATNKVTKLVRNEELEIQNNTGMVKFSANFRIIPQGKKCQVICSSIVSSESNTFAFAKPVLNLLARRELQTDMRALKLAVEHHLE